MRRVILVTILVGCSGRKSDPPPPPPEPPKPPSLRFGDCRETALEVPWIAGARPVETEPMPAVRYAVDPELGPLGSPPPALDLPASLATRAPLVTQRIGHTQYDTDPWYAPDDIAFSRARFQPTGPWAQFGDLTANPAFLDAGTTLAHDGLEAAYPAFVACYATTKPAPTDPATRVHVAYTIGKHARFEPGTIPNADITGATGAFATCLRAALPIPFDELGPIGATIVFHPVAPPPTVAPAPQRALTGWATSSGESRGERDPLRTREPAIARCLAGATAGVGAAIVDATFDPKTRTLTHAEVRGVGLPAGSEACIATAVAGLARDPADTDAKTDRLRCGFAFGTPTTANAPTVTVTPAALWLDGKPLADQPDAPWLDALYQHAHVRHAAIANVPAPGATEPPVALHLPYGLVVDDAVTMRTLARVMSSILVAGEDFVFVVHGAAEVPAPAPLPLGDGAPWNRVRPLRSGGLMVEGSSSVILAVVVRPHDIAVEVARLNQHDTVSQANLVAKLKEQRGEGKFFGDRNDLRLAAAPDTTYGQLRAAIAAVEAAGFTGWELVDPADLPID